METGQQLISRIESEINVELFDLDLSARKYEARLIAEYVTGDEYSKLITGRYDLSEHRQCRIEEITIERNKGVPLAYVINNTHFYGIDLFVDQRVLIPRPETEIVVEQAINIINKSKKLEPLVLDLCTGSGAIAIAISNNHPMVQIIGSDISQDAIDVAKLNAATIGNNSARIEFVNSDLFDQIDPSLKGSVDLIVSNPPYIGIDEIKEVEKSVLAFEPYQALFSDENGTMHYKEIIALAGEWLTRTGKLVLEISPRHVEFIDTIARENNYTDVEIIRDLQGRERVAILG